MSYPGIYRAKVTAVEAGTGRVKLIIPQVSGTAVTNWSHNCSPSNSSVVAPPVGTVVWVFFEGGDINNPVWMPAPGVFGRVIGHDRWFERTYYR